MSDAGAAEARRDEVAGPGRGARSEPSTPSDARAKQGRRREAPGPPSGARSGRTGRRPGNPGTREAILVAAREAFAANGFTRATIRAIATGAGVDPALVHHYFGTKEKLFLATIQVPVNPREVVDAITDGPAATLGLRLATAVLGVWESPAGPALAAALRSAMADPDLVRTVREFLFSQVIGRVLRSADCPPDELALRGGLVVSQLAGALVGRYILALEPLASQPLRTLVPEIGATLQRYLSGPLAASAGVAPDTIG